MTDVERRQAATRFAEYWRGKGYEKGESQKFWLSLLSDVYGVEHAAEYIAFEEKVFLGHTSFIDGYISATRVLIEQKSIGSDLRKPIRQSDGTLLTPIQQAKRYITELPVDKHPKWVITCNFERFLVYDMNRPNEPPIEVLLENLPAEHYLINFLVNAEDEHIKREMEISIQAGEIVGKLYDALLKEYIDPNDERALKSLNALCVRLVFCLYAEDAGVFGSRMMFHDYLRASGVTGARAALIELFRVLDRQPEARDRYLARANPSLAAFPYVNGGLFSDEAIEIPVINQEIYDLLLTKASEDFDWSEISPAIFGAVFESTLNPETRRKGGMHYTSLANIHKVIDPLFLDELSAELAGIFDIPVDKDRHKALADFQDKLASLRFLDPACGSGNFLTESYLCLRKLENEAIRGLLDSRTARNIGERQKIASGQIALGFEGDESPIKVSISQFYGIEINDFAATVAKTALWIAESQMMKRTEDIIHMSLNFLPLKSYVNIIEGNALRMDWETLIPKNELSYIMGNPPFVGYSFQSDAQKRDILSVFVDEKGKPYKAAGKIDYVASWFFKASQFIQNMNISVAFVATNSITQGEQVSSIWKPLYMRFRIRINFAYRAFRWDSEANNIAHVYCVIIGFSCNDSDNSRKLFVDNAMQIVGNINPYLADAPITFIDSRTKPLCDVPVMIYGNKPTDGGYLLLSPEEKDELIFAEPDSARFIRRVYGATEYINNTNRFCLWLVDASPADIRKSKLIKARVDSVRRFRLESKKEVTRLSADTPMLFQEIRQPSKEYILVPSVSSEKRKYIPIGFIDASNITTNANLVIPDATLYHFGVLVSNVHMAWMRAVAGRLEMRYRYSANIVYNNFPWPDPTDAQRAAIEQSAREILDARALFPDSSLADLYDETTMPPALRRAHQRNDRAVLRAYGFDTSGARFSEADCVARLMEMYAALVGD